MSQYSTLTISLSEDYSRLNKGIKNLKKQKDKKEIVLQRQPQAQSLSFSRCMQWIELSIDRFSFKNARGDSLYTFFPRACACAHNLTAGNISQVQRAKRTVGEKKERISRVRLESLQIDRSLLNAELYVCAARARLFSLDYLPV